MILFTTRHIEGLNLRKQNKFQLPRPKTVSYGTESMQYLGIKIWNLIPMEMKSANNLQIFKANIKTLIPKDCPCRLCKNYVVGVGFLS